MQSPSAKATTRYRRRSRVLVTLVGIGTAAALVFGASSLVASPSTHPILERISLVERQTNEQFIDLGKHGLSVGDHNVIRSDILDPKGKLVGRMDADCTITGVGPKLGGLCHGAMTLPAGQLIAEFAWGRSGSTRLQAILGGTGKYEDARGQAIVNSHGSDSHEEFVVELVR